MLPATVSFNVGGTVFEVALSMIQSQLEGLLAKMVDGRFESGKDESGAYFVCRNPHFETKYATRVFQDLHCDNKVCPLSLRVNHERLLADLEFYVLQDFEGASITPS